MKGKVLIVDDHIDIISFVKPALEAEGFEVEFVLSGKEALVKAKDGWSVIILDVQLPDLTGFDICQQIRQSVLCPIIFLTARGLEDEKVKGFLLGGDDYIVKPFSLKELILRIKVHLRKTPKGLAEEEHKKMIFGNLVIDLLAKKVIKDGNEIECTKKEFQIIELLCTHRKQVFSKEQIFEKIWGYMSESDVNTVTEHIRRIRAKLSSPSVNHSYIKTVWG
ncbi:response regulator transcription factor [Caldalkalibacillus mannanilyticus]|uniref:response regulator transcription factor n=1 Tax=Caldalkalibacillus mannanilyticus TaxID=1418 RepID=UPI000AF182A9|nr:response regulator transcription factor [Caldalkalibacillus mannanilyticus]